MGFALILAMVSAILSLIAPNKLSDLADEIQKGIVPKTEKIEVITKEISKSFEQDNLINKIKEINESKEISQQDKITFNNTLQGLKSIENKEQAFVLVTALPEDVLECLLEEIKVDNIKIPVKDQIKMLELTKEMATAKPEDS